MNHAPELPLWARPLQSLLNRNLARSASAAALCRRLDGRRLQLDAGSPALSLWLEAQGNRLDLHPGQAESADAILAGSPLALLGLAGDDPAGLIRSGRVRLAGDTDVAADFQALLGFLRPDPEEELAGIVGDSLAHGIGQAARAVGGWVDHSSRSVARSLSEYLAEESRVLVTPLELREFAAEVDELAACADRCEARLDWLRSRLLTD